MSKRATENITLGSGKPYIMEYAGTMPIVDDICKSENLLGYVKGGATLTYTGETYEEKDDLGYVTKVILTTEEVLLKLGLLTWNGTTLNKLVATGRVTEADGKRTIKIGGIGNDNGKSYVICFKHEDSVDGNLWILIRGKNQAGFTLTLAADSGTVIEPEFKALPQDTEGTLVTLIEELGTATYTITKDTSITAGKTYYTRSGSSGAYVYTPVETPDVSNIATYYEASYA